MLTSSPLPGGPTAAVIAFNNPNIKVTVVDKDEGRIRRWNSRHLPIYEPGLAEMVRAARDGLPANAKDKTPAHAPNLFFSADVARCIAEADIVIIAVNTPTKSRGAGAGSATDMTAFEAVTAVVVQHARLGAIIVEKSTVPCRTAELVEDMVRTTLLVFYSCRPRQCLALVRQGQWRRCQGTNGDSGLD